MDVLHPVSVGKLGTVVNCCRLEEADRRHGKQEAPAIADDE